MKKFFTLSLICLSICLFGQNPKKITPIPGAPSTAFFSWDCNGLQFYQDYLESTNSTQIWRTDGTESGTFPLTNFPAGSGQLRTSSTEAAVVANVFYFSFIRFSSGSNELWKSDGTVSGTVQIDISPITIHSGALTHSGALIANSTHLFITTYYPNEDLYSIDHSGQLTYLARLKPGIYYSLLEGHAAIFRDKLVVAQTRFDLQGNPLSLEDFFITDGTVAGSYTKEASLPVVPRQMTPCGDQFLLIMLPNYPYPNNSFAKLPGISNGGIGDMEVFYTGTGADDMIDYNHHRRGGGLYGDANGIEPLKGNSVIGNSILLSGYSDNLGWELWKTDGTAAGTTLVKDIYPGTGSGYDRSRGFVINGKFIFFAYSPTSGNKLFYSDGTNAGTDFFPQSVSDNFGLSHVCYSGGKAYFPSNTIEGNSAIWQTDGGIKNTLPLTPYDISPSGDVAPFGVVGSGNILYKTTDVTGLIRKLAALDPNFQLWNGFSDNDWHNPLNWEGTTVPPSSANVLIPLTPFNSPEINQNSPIHSLWINGRTLTTNNNLELAGDLSVESFTSLSGSGNLFFTEGQSHFWHGDGNVAIPVNISGDVRIINNNKTIPQLNFYGVAGRIRLGDYDLTVSSDITGASGNNFVVTDGVGRLILPDIGTSASSTSRLFPVGSNNSSYTPIIISNNGVSMQWNVRVTDGAYNSYNTVYPETPASSPLSENAVNKTWFISHGNGDLLNPSVEFQWNAADELPGLNRTSMRAGHYNNGWSYSSSGIASGNNPYTFTYNNVPAFSPFTLTNGVTDPLTCSAIQVTPVLCLYGDNGSATVTASGGTPPYSYLWDNTETTATAIGLIAGQHTVTVTDANQYTTTCTVNITQPSALFQCEIVQISPATCGLNNGVATVNPIDGTAPYTYLWDNGEATQTATGLFIGNHSVTVTDANGCTSFCSVSIAEVTAISCSAEQISPASCGVNNGSAIVTVHGAGPGDFVQITWDNGQTTTTATGLSPGLHTVFIVDQCGFESNCSVNIGQSSVSTVVVEVSSQTNVGCQGGNNGEINVTASGGVVPYTYQWTGTGVNPSTEDQTGLTAGDYSVIVTDANGCISDPLSITITQPSTPLTVSVTGTSASCNGSASATPAGGAAPYTYLWNNGATTQSVNDVPAGTYTVTVSDANNCTASASYTITGNSPINPTASVVNVSCFGGSDGSITVTGAGGTAPHIYNINGSTFQTGNVFTNLPAGAYVVGAKDATGCIDFVTKTITQPLLLTVTLTNIRTACYGTNSGRIDITISGGTGTKSYSWTGPNGYASSVQDPNNIVAGNYSVTVTDAKGCTANLNVIVPEWPAIIISETVTHVGCRGDFSGAIDATISGGTGVGFSIGWTGPNTFVATTEDINGLKAGNYRITVTDVGSGCSLQKTITVTQPATLVNVSATKTNITTCGGFGTITATGSGGTAPYEYSLDGGAYQVSGLFSVYTAGIHQITVRDIKGCTKTITVTISDTGSDSYEPNNSRLNAAVINLNATINARIAPGASDVDWFRFTTGSISADYVVSFVHPLIANYTITLHTGTGTLITPSASSPGSATYTGLGVSTDYFIKVLSTSASLICYNLTINGGIQSRSPGILITKDKDQKVIDSRNGEVSVNVFPNPHKGDFTLQIGSSIEGWAYIEMFDISGRKIGERKVYVNKGSVNNLQFLERKSNTIFYRVRIDKIRQSGIIIGPR